MTNSLTSNSAISTKGARTGSLASHAETAARARAGAVGAGASLRSKLTAMDLMLPSDALGQPGWTLTSTLCRRPRIDPAGVQSEIEFAFAGLPQLCLPLLDRLERLPAPQCEALATAFGLRAGTPPDRFFVGLAVPTLRSEAAEEQPLRVPGRRRAMARSSVGAGGALVCGRSRSTSGSETGSSPSSAQGTRPPTVARRGGRHGTGRRRRRGRGDQPPRAASFAAPELVRVRLAGVDLDVGPVSRVARARGASRGVGVAEVHRFDVSRGVPRVGPLVVRIGPRRWIRVGGWLVQGVMHIARMRRRIVRGHACFLLEDRLANVSGVSEKHLRASQDLRSDRRP